MSWLSGIVSGAKALLGGGSGGGSDNVMKVASGIGGWIDGQQFTEQERVEANAALIPAMADFMANTVNENSQRSMTRREIALWVMRNWVVMLWVAIVARGVELVIDATNHEFSNFVLQIATIEGLVYFVLGIGAFFFGAHIVRQVQKR